MAARYNDVDLLILKRWDEVKALRESFDVLVERMEDVVKGVLQQVSTTLMERKWLTDLNSGRPSIWYWKPGWANRKNEPGIYLEIFDFAPFEYGKDVEEHPSVWLMTDEFSRLKVRESSEEFSRSLRAMLSPELLTKWGSHPDADLSDWPLGRACTGVTESDRLRLVTDTEALVQFILSQVDETMELVPLIDQAAQRLTRR